MRKYVNSMFVNYKLMQNIRYFKFKKKVYFYTNCGMDAILFLVNENIDDGE